MVYQWCTNGANHISTPKDEINVETVEGEKHSPRERSSSLSSRIEALLAKD